MTMIDIVQADIIGLEVDAIVNAAAPGLGGGTGVSRAIHDTAGPDLFTAVEQLDFIGRGDAGITPGFNLKARWVIHAVGPVYINGLMGEDKVLARTYHRCLELAVEVGARSIAFPAISTGAYRFPKDKAALIALNTVRDFVDAHRAAFDRVIFCARGNDNIAALHNAMNATVR